MTTYSHSRLSTFENCKYKYKLQYIDKINELKDMDLIDEDKDNKAFKITDAGKIARL